MFMISGIFIHDCISSDCVELLYIFLLAKSTAQIKLSLLFSVNFWCACHKYNYCCATITLNIFNKFLSCLCASINYNFDLQWCVTLLSMQSNVCAYVNVTATVNEKDSIFD